MMHNDHQIVLTKKLQKRWYSVLKQFTFYYQYESDAIGKPERHVHKASHRGSKQQ